MNKKNIQRFEKRKGRLLVVNGIRWKVTIGKISAIAYSEKGDRRIGLLSKVAGIPWHIWERGQWKRTSDGMLTPKHICRWLS